MTMPALINIAQIILNLNLWRACLINGEKNFLHNLKQQKYSELNLRKFEKKKKEK